jgi:hypothetical protein
LDLPPLYGAIGALGVRGLEDRAEDYVLAGESPPLSFRSSRFYNLHASGIISQRQFLVGAHSDFVKPDIARVIWQSILS